MEIAKHHSATTLCIDFFYVQRLPFLHAISRKIGYRQAMAVSDRTKETMLTFASKCIREYTKRGFEVVDAHTDKEFECLRNELGNVSLEVCGPDEHVPEVERSIRTMKETMRATAHGLPYRRLPKLMITELVALATRCLNAFPKDDGVSDHMSPPLHRDWTTPYGLQQNPIGVWLVRTASGPLREHNPVTYNWCHCSEPHGG